MLIKVHPSKKIKDANPEWETIKAILPGLNKLTDDQIIILALTVDIENNPISGIEKSKKAEIISSIFGYPIEGVEDIIDKCFDTNTVIGVVASEYIKVQAAKIPEIFAYYVMSEKMVDLSREIQITNIKVDGTKSEDSTYERIMQFQKDIATMANNIRSFRAVIAADIEKALWEIVSETITQQSGSALRASWRK